MEVEFEFPVLMFKSKKLVNFIYKLGKKFSKFFITLGNFAVFLSIPLSIIAADFLIKGAGKILGGAPSQVSILIPGVKLPGSSFKLPFFEGLLIIFLLAIFHEGFHALVSSAQGIKPKNFAFLLFLLIPAAGVEIDEELLKRRRKIERLRIFASGSLGNLILALICLLLTFPIGSLLKAGIEEKGLLVTNVTNPEINLKPGYVIKGINGTEIKSIEDLFKFLNKIKPGEFVEINTKNGTFIGKTKEFDGKARLGVYLKPLIEYKSWWAKPLAFIARVLLLSFQINIGVALINLLPIYFLDGGKIYEEIYPKIYRFFAPLFFFLLIFNMIGPYLPL